MQNSIDQRDLTYTLLGAKHEGYTIEWAINPSKSEPGKWLGHYVAHKVGESTLRASIVNTYDNPADAQNETIRIAKAMADKAIAEKS
jgi:hypothetical protein